jgi:hypothetical protein
MGRFDLRTRTGQVSAIIQGQGATSVDVDAQAFFDRVTTAGGTLSQTEKDAVNTLTLTLKVLGIWTIMKVVYPMVGASAAACAQNLKSSSFTGTFSSGWVFTSLSANPNGTSAFFNTGFNTSTNLIKTSVHLSVYVRNNSSTGSPYEMGNASNAGMTTDNTIIQVRYSNNNAYFAVADNGLYRNNTPSSNSQGFWCGTRITNTDYLYKNGTILVNNASGGGNLANNNLFIGATNAGGTAAFFSNKECAFASIGDELSSTQVANFYSAVQTFQTTLSRNV